MKEPARPAGSNVVSAWARRRVPWAFFCALALAAPAATPGRAEVADQVAAVVNGEIITLSDIRWLVRYKRLPIPEDPERRKLLYLDTARQLVEQKLIAAEAAQTPGIQVDSQEVEDRVEAYRRQFASQEEFLRNLAEMEMGLEDLRELVRRQLAVLKFVKLRFEPFIIVLPDEIRTYYREQLVPELESSQQAAPPLSLVEEQIRQILTLEETNKEVDSWVENARSKANVEILLYREPGDLPNLPPALSNQIQIRPLPPPQG